MSAFSRIKVEYVKQMSDAACMRGLDHDIMPFPGKEFSEWATFRFANPRAKATFDNLCAEGNVALDGSQVVNVMLDGVLGGDNPKSVIEKVLTRKITKGMNNAYGKLRVKYRCTGCGITAPIYPGGYTRSCPDCGGAWGAP